MLFIIANFMGVSATGIDQTFEIPDNEIIIALS